MKKTLSMLLVVTLVLLMLVGCTGNGKTPDTTTTTTSASAGDTVKTGLAVSSSIGKSKDAAATADGLAQVDTSVAAVTVDNNGKIVKCVIDAVQTKVNFTTAGKIKTDLKSEFKTKNELGIEYGMKKASKLGKEWNEQAAAFAKYVEGKTLDEVKGIAVNEEGSATAAELTSSVTITVKGLINVVAAAVANAKDIGSKSSDKLGLGITTNIEKSKDVSDKDGVAQAYSTYTATTFDASGKITGCIIDASQTNVNFSKAGKITTDLKSTFKTKNELGAEYGMKKASKIGKEWNEQAAAFANYVKGKSVVDVKSIAINAETAPTGADLTSSVTISVGGFISIIEKANLTAK